MQLTGGEEPEQFEATAAPRRPRRGAGAARSAGCGSGAEAMPLLSSMPFAQSGRGASAKHPQARTATATGGRR